MTWKNSACMSIGRSLCPDMNNLVSMAPASKSSAIDNFYVATTPTLTRIDPTFLSTYGDDISGLLFVGLVSSTENYFRDILGLILTICPCAQAHAADEKVQLGSLLWAENSLQNRSAFEFMAFSSAENIRKAIGNFAHYQIRKAGNFDVALKEYDKLCELRHAVVHSGHIVAGKNAIKLGLARTSKTLKVRLCYADLQSAGSVCTALVQAANTELFEVLVSRWAQDWRVLPSWQPAREMPALRKLRDGFLSKRDQANKTIPTSRTLAALMAELQTVFNL